MKQEEISTKSPKSIVEERLEKNTRRWGTTAKAPTFIENKFRSFSGLFFYPLARDFDNPRYLLISSKYRKYPIINLLAS